MIQRSIFDPPPPAQRHSYTSRGAADHIAGKAGTLRARLYDWLAARGEQGATDEEAALALGMGGSTARPRRIELQRRGLVRDSGRTRPTQAGLQAVVWVVVGGQPS